VTLRSVALAATARYIGDLKCLGERSVRAELDHGLDGVALELGVVRKAVRCQRSDNSM
jgi:hypothetical protein